MPDVRFEWDPIKAAANLRKHGIAFDEAQTVFEDEEALILPDPDHSHDEERFVLLGASLLRNVLAVVHCERSADGAIRLISARKADRDERATYIARRTP